MESRFAPYADVRKIVMTPEIFNRIGDDHSPKRKGFKVPKKGYVAIGGYIDDKIVSLYTIHGKKNIHGNDMHFMVLKPYRKYARKLLQSAIKFWPFDVYCKIPSLYMGVINFAKKSGFEEIEVTPSKHLKNGKLYNVHKLILRIKK